MYLVLCYLRPGASRNAVLQAMPRISTLPPGTRFRLIEMEEITGTLVKGSDSRAVVRLDRPDQEVEFTDPETGELRAFKARSARMTSWAATTLVRPIGFEPLLDDEENEMSKVATKKTKSEKSQSPKAKAATQKAPKPRAADGKLSCIDAAAKV